MESNLKKFIIEKVIETDYISAFSEQDMLFDERPKKGDTILMDGKEIKIRGCEAFAKTTINKGQRVCFKI